MYNRNYYKRSAGWTNSHATSSSYNRDRYRRRPPYDERTRKSRQPDIADPWLEQSTKNSNAFRGRGRARGWKRGGTLNDQNWNPPVVIASSSAPRPSSPSPAPPPVQQKTNDVLSSATNHPELNSTLVDILQHFGDVPAELTPVPSVSCSDKRTKTDSVKDRRTSIISDIDSVNCLSDPNEIEDLAREIRKILNDHRNDEYLVRKVQSPERFGNDSNNNASSSSYEDANFDAATDILDGAPDDKTASDFTRNRLHDFDDTSSSDFLDNNTNKDLLTGDEIVLDFAQECLEAATDSLDNNIAYSVSGDNLDDNEDSGDKIECLDNSDDAATVILEGDNEDFASVYRDFERCSSSASLKITRDKADRMERRSRKRSISCDGRIDEERISCSSDQVVNFKRDYRNCPFDDMSLVVFEKVQMMSYNDYLETLTRSRSVETMKSPRKEPEMEVLDQNQQIHTKENKKFNIQQRKDSDNESILLNSTQEIIEKPTKTENNNKFQNSTQKINEKPNNNNNNKLQNTTPKIIEKPNNNKLQNATQKLSEKPNNNNNTKLQNLFGDDSDSEGEIRYKVLTMAKRKRGRPRKPWSAKKQARSPNVVQTRGKRNGKVRCSLDIEKIVKFDDVVHKSSKLENLKSQITKDIKIVLVDFRTEKDHHQTLTNSSTERKSATPPVDQSSIISSSQLTTDEELIPWIGDLKSRMLKMLDTMRLIGSQRTGILLKEMYFKFSEDKRDIVTQLKSLCSEITDWEQRRNFDVGKLFGQTTSANIWVSLEKKRKQLQELEEAMQREQKKLNESMVDKSDTDTQTENVTHDGVMDEEKTDNDGESNKNVEQGLNDKKTGKIELSETDMFDMFAHGSDKHTISLSVTNDDNETHEMVILSESEGNAQNVEPVYQNLKKEPEAVTDKENVTVDNSSKTAVTVHENILIAPAVSSEEPPAQIEEQPTTGSVVESLISNLLKRQFKDSHIPEIPEQSPAVLNKPSKDSVCAFFVEAITFGNGDYKSVDHIYKFSQYTSLSTGQNVCEEFVTKCFVNVCKMFFVLEAYYNPTQFEKFDVGSTRNIDSSKVEETFCNNMQYVCSHLSLLLDSLEDFEIKDWTAFMNHLVNLVNENVVVHFCLLTKLLSKTKVTSQSGSLIRVKLFTYFSVLYTINSRVFLSLSREFFADIEREVADNIIEFSGQWKTLLKEANSKLNIEDDDFNEASIRLAICNDHTGPNTNLSSFKHRNILTSTQSIVTKFQEMFCNTCKIVPPKKRKIVPNEENYTPKIQIKSLDQLRDLSNVNSLANRVQTTPIPTSASQMHAEYKRYQEMILENAQKQQQQAYLQRQEAQLQQQNVRNVRPHMAAQTWGDFNATNRQPIHQQQQNQQQQQQNQEQQQPVYPSSNFISNNNQTPIQNFAPFQSNITKSVNPSYHPSLNLQQTKTFNAQRPAPPSRRNSRQSPPQNTPIPQAHQLSNSYALNAPSQGQQVFNNYANTPQSHQVSNNTYVSTTMTIDGSNAITTRPAHQQLYQTFSNTARFQISPVVQNGNGPHQNTQNVPSGAASLPNMYGQARSSTHSVTNGSQQTVANCLPTNLPTNHNMFYQKLPNANTPMLGNYHNPNNLTKPAYQPIVPLSHSQISNMYAERGSQNVPYLNNPPNMFQPARQQNSSQTILSHQAQNLQNVPKPSVEYPSVNNSASPLLRSYLVPQNTTSAQSFIRTSCSSSVNANSAPPVQNIYNSMLNLQSKTSIVTNSPPQQNNLHHNNGQGNIYQRTPLNSFASDLSAKSNLPPAHNAQNSTYNGLLQKQSPNANPFPAHNYNQPVNMSTHYAASSVLSPPITPNTSYENITPSPTLTTSPHVSAVSPLNNSSFRVATSTYFPAELAKNKNPNVFPNSLQPISGQNFFDNAASSLTAPLDGRSVPEINNRVIEISQPRPPSGSPSSNCDKTDKTTLSDRGDKNQLVSDALNNFMKSADFLMKVSPQDVSKVLKEVSRGNTANQAVATLLQRSILRRQSSETIVILDDEEQIKEEPADELESLIKEEPYKIDFGEKAGGYVPIYRCVCGKKAGILCECKQAIYCSIECKMKEVENHNKFCSVSKKD